jgi:opacity protein-like surface antigen
MNYQNYGSTNWYYRTSFFFDAGGDRTDYYDEIPINWNNTFGIGAGVEYVFKTGLGRLPVRAGFRFDQLAQPKDFTITYNNVDYDADEEPFELDQMMVTRVADGRQNEYSFGLGAGVSWSQIELDFAYRYTTGAESTVAENFTLYDETVIGNVLNGSQFVKWENTSHEFRVTFTGYF